RRFFPTVELVSFIRVERAYLRLAERLFTPEKNNPRRGTSKVVLTPIACVADVPTYDSPRPPCKGTAARTHLEIFAPCSPNLDPQIQHQGQERYTFHQQALQFWR